MRKPAIYFIVFFAFHSLQAQLLDSAKQVVQYRLYNQDAYQNFDSTLIQSYHFNILQNELNANLGNVASPSFNVDDLFQNPFFWEYKPTLFSRFYSNIEKSRFYDTKRPFTRLQYTQGKRNEQILKLLFTVNVKPNWNIAFEYNRHTVAGLYLSQKTGIHQLNFTSEYLSKNKRFKGNYFVIYNASKWQENGGLTNDTTYLQDAFQSRLTVPVNISSGESREIKSKIGFANAYMFTTENDVNTGVQHEFSYHFDKHLFVDKNPQLAFYGNHFHNDSVYFTQKSKRFLNQIHFLVQSKSFRNGIGLGYDYAYTFNRVDTLIPRMFASVYSNYNSQKINNTFSAKFDIKNAYYTIDNQFSIAVFRNYFLKFIAAFNNNPQALCFQKFIQNDSVYWNVKLNSKRSQKFDVELSNNKYFKLKYSFANIQHYYDFYRQMDVEKLNIQYVEAILPLSFKKLHLDNSVQYLWAKDSIIPLPDFFVKTSLYLQHKAFKKATELRYGAEMEYFSVSRKIAYALPLGAFYVEQKAELKNTPQLNLFVAARLTKAKIFLRMDNILQNVSHEANFSAYYYPQRDRTFSFGIIWDLLN